MPTDTIPDRVHDPIHRVAYSFRRDGDDLWVECWMAPGAHLPEHFHPTLEEHWETLDGVVRVKLDGAWRDLRPDDGPVLVGRDVRHELRNESDRPAHLRTHVSPAGTLQDFLVESARAACEGMIGEGGLPTSRRAAGWVGRFALRFRHETVMCSPPPALQRVLLPLVARLG